MKRHGSARRAVALAALACLPPGCAKAPARPASAILITLDTTRTDALSVYGNGLPTTPHLDALAREGVTYESASSVAPLTLPSHASMLTGLYPLRHSVRENSLWPLPQSARTLAELASEAGVQTAAFVAARVLDASFGLDQGFERYSGPPRPQRQTTTHFAERPAGEVVAEALQWLAARDRSRPFLLWVHVFEPHAPYAPPPDLRAAPFADSPYLGEVAAADRALGVLIDALRADGTLAEAAVLVVSDHGEAFGEHGLRSHGPFAYQATISVPLFLRYPDGWRAGERSRELVSVADVFPTLADALGLDRGAEPAVDGISLWRRDVPAGRGVYFESYAGWLSLGWSPLAGWRDERGKYLHSSAPELYDLAADPLEQHDLAAERPDELRRYRDAIAAVAQLPALEATGESIDDAMLAELRGLGYTGMGTRTPTLPHPLAPSDRPAPAQRIEAHVETLYAQKLMNEGQPAEALAILERVTAETPENWYALDLRAYVLMQQGRHAEAIGHLRRLLRDGPERASATFNLAVCLNRVGRRDEALEALLRTVELDPTHLEALDGVAQLLEESERAQEAAPFRERLRALLAERQQAEGAR